MKVMGIDASKTSSGWSIIEDEKLIAFGLIKTTTKDKFRLKIIYESISKLIKKYKPDIILMEDGFSGPNKKVSIELGKVRGVIELLSQQNNYEIILLQPAQVKKMIAGNGNAKKELVAEILCEIYKNNSIFLTIGPFSSKQGKKKTDDIYDAISIALYYFYNIRESLQD
jgi:crossover junction endodeoxyribonuclease RuvC